MLHFVLDRSGWWNLYRERDGLVEAVAPVEAELGWMQWVFGMSSYVFLADGRIACILNRGARQTLTFIADGEYEEAGVPYDSAGGPSLRGHGNKLTWICASATKSPVLLLLDALSREFEVLASSVARTSNSLLSAVEEQEHGRFRRRGADPGELVSVTSQRWPARRSRTAPPLLRTRRRR